MPAQTVESMATGEGGEGMRLAECMQREVRLAQRMLAAGDLGGVTEGFSEETQALRASLIPMDGAFSAEERGVKCSKRLRLLVAGDVRAAAGDGVWVDGRLYRIVSTAEWSAHTEWICEAVE